MCNVESRSLVDEKSVTFAANVTNIATKKRRKRVAVLGGHGLEVNEAGRFFDKWGNTVEPHGNGHLIHPGMDYSGPVWPAHGNMFGHYLADPNGHRDRKALRETEYDRVAAELVAYEFLGRPPASWEFVTVAHLDGDRNNRHRDNLCYVVNELAIDNAQQMKVKSLMRGPISGARLNIRARDPYGTRMRNVFAVADDSNRRREGQDMGRNPLYLPDKPRTLEPWAS